MSKLFKSTLFLALAALSFCTVSCESESEDLSGVLKLVASVDEMTIENGSSVTFSAFVDELNVTNDPSLKIYCIDESKKFTSVSDAQFTAIAAGQYDFYAFYSSNMGDMQSETLSINASFDIDKVDYQKRIAATQFTATWCGYCPLMTSGLYHYGLDYGDDKIVTASAHGTDVMANSYSNYMANNMNIMGYPTLLVGSLDYTKAISIATDYSYSTIVNSIASAVSTVEAQGVGTAISVGSSEANGVITISALVAVGKDGSYGVGAWLLEDGISAAQTTYLTLSEIGLSGYDTSNHKNVLQGLYPTEKDFNEELGGESSHTAGEFYTMECEIYTSSIGSLSKLDNCRVAVYTVDLESGYVDNIVQAPLGTTRAFDTKN